MLTPEQFDQWTDELIYGGLEQTTSALKLENAYCCLGVLCEKVLGVDLDAPITADNAHISYTDPREDLPLSFMTGVAEGPRALFETLDEYWRGALAAMNDSGSTFADIGRFLQKHREEVLSGVAYIREED